MRITRTSVLVDDQTRARAFYVDVLGFEVRHDIPLGEFSWLTVVSPEAPDGVELLLEPAQHPAAATFTAAMKADGLPVVSFTVDDVRSEHARLVAAGVTFVQPPTEAGPVVTAVLDDTCGNLVQLLAEVRSG